MRVAVTTTADAFPRIAASLQARGLTPVMLPCIEIEPAEPGVLNQLRSAAESADWLLLTSPRAVRITWSSHRMPPVSAACVGPATAGAVEAAGGVPALVGSAGSDRLVEELATKVSGRVVVFPHARAADPAHIGRLEAAGATVVAAPAYDTIPIAPPDDPVDAVILGSPSSLEGWLKSRELDGLLVAAMGPTTATALAERDRSADIVPDRPGFDRLATLMARYAVEGGER